MENTIENKAIFFAQYWGREVLMDVTNGGKLTSYVIEPSNMYRIEESHLELKPLSQLTDEDAIEIAKYYYGEKHVETHPGDHFKYIRAVKEDITNKLHGVTAIQITDYLRRHGYAILYSTLTVNKQLEYGWVKLKEENWV